VLARVIVRLDVRAADRAKSTDRRDIVQRFRHLARCWLCRSWPVQRHPAISRSVVTRLVPCASE